MVVPSHPRTSQSTAAPATSTVTPSTVTPVRFHSSTTSPAPRALVAKPAIGLPGTSVRKRVFDYDVEDDNMASNIYLIYALTLKVDEIDVTKFVLDHKHITL